MAGEEKENLKADESKEKMEDLLTRARSGEGSAVSALAVAYSPDVYRLARYLLHSEEEAKDAAADVFVRLYTAGEKIPMEGFKPWLMRVAYNYCQDLLRRRSTLSRLLPRIYRRMNEAASPGPEQAALEADEREEVRRAVARLPDVEKAVVVLRYYHQLSYSEIGMVLDIPEATVGTRLYRARDKLRGMLSFCEGGGKECNVQTAMPGECTLMENCSRLSKRSLRSI